MLIRRERIVGVAIKMGATKDDFDSCVAIRECLVPVVTHPAVVDRPLLFSHRPYLV